MQANITVKLSVLNRQFYQTFALAFSATRQRLQPGVLRVLARVQGEEAILDLGCGNGELGRELALRGHRGPYLGVDFSAGLLANVSLGEAMPPNIQFAVVDISRPDWTASIRGRFELILAFAVLHHIPGDENRLQLLRTVRDLLLPGGLFIHSNWQFLNSRRLRARIQPWEAIGLSAAQVDAGDYLLDWRRGGYGLRYVHHFSEDELRSLAAASGFGVIESFYSDGREGNLGLYQVWERPQAAVS